MDRKLVKQVMTEFAEQDKINAKLVMLETRYNGFVICHEFGKNWLGKTGDGGTVLVDSKGRELGRWAVGVNCWAEVCNIVSQKLGVIV